MIKKNTRQVLLTLSSIATLMLAGSALGQDLTSGNSSLEGKDDPATVGMLTLKPTYTHLFEADGDNDLGNVTVDRAELRAAYTLKTGEAQFGLGGMYEYSNYQFESGIGGLDEDFDVNRLGFNAHYMSMVNENWGYFGYGGIEMAATSDADLDDGLIGTVAAGARYVWSTNLSLGFGAAFASGIEADDRVMPLIILQWQINEHWALRGLNGVTVTYDISGDKKTVIDAGVNFQYREYATGDSSSVSEKMVVVEVGVTHRFCKEFAMRGFVGMVSGREFEIYGRATPGDRDRDVDAGAIAGISATLTF